MDPLKLYVKNPFFDQIIDGTKTVEGRLFKPKLHHLKVLSTLQIVLSDSSLKCVDVQIIGLRTYTSFEQMLLKEGVQNCLPGVSTLSEGIAIYHSFPEYRELEKEYGVLAIKLKNKQTFLRSPL